MDNCDRQEVSVTVLLLFYFIYYNKLSPYLVIIIRLAVIIISIIPSHPHYHHYTRIIRWIGSMMMMLTMMVNGGPCTPHHPHSPQYNIYNCLSVSPWSLLAWMASCRVVSIVVSCASAVRTCSLLYTLNCIQAYLGRSSLED